MLPSVSFQGLVCMFLGLISVTISGVVIPAARGCAVLAAKCSSSRLPEMLHFPELIVPSVDLLDHVWSA